MEYFAIIKRNLILLHAIAWMNPENIMLSQTQKDKYVIHLYEEQGLGNS